MNNKRSQFSIMDDIMNDNVNDKKGHNIVNDNFAHKPDGLLVKHGSIAKAVRLPLKHVRKHTKIT